MPDSLDIRSPTDGMQRTPLPLTSPSLPSVRPRSSPSLLQLSLHDRNDLSHLAACQQHVLSVASRLLHSVGDRAWPAHAEV